MHGGHEVLMEVDFIKDWPNLSVNERAHFCTFIDYRGQHRKSAAIYNTAIGNLQPKPWFQWTKMDF
jgi:hypothetical protein